MWKLSRECSPRHFLNISGYQYFLSRSKAHDAVARECVTDEAASSQTDRSATRLPSWFAFNDDDRTMPIFVTPRGVSSSHVTDQFGLLCNNQPSTSTHPSTSIERGPFADALIPTTYVEDPTELRLVNNSRESEGTESECRGVLRGYDADADADALRLFDHVAPSEERPSPTIRRRTPMRAIHWHTRAMRGIRPARMHRLRSRRHVVNSWRTLPSRAESRTHPATNTVSETEVEDEVCEGPFLLSKLNARSSDRASFAEYVNTAPASTSRSTQDDVQQLRPETGVAELRTVIAESSEEDTAPQRPTVSRTVFDPLEVRSERVPVATLRRLTKEKDVEGLRMALNEYQWPHFESMRGFISELFQVFIEKGLNVDEVKRLMWDFAATNNRAYVRDAVTVSLLERVVREEGVDAATNYARLNRALFLVKAPMERRNSKCVSHQTERLFATVFEQGDGNDELERASKLLDTLIDLGYINDNSPFLIASLLTRLHRKGYTAAQQLWTWNVLKYRSTLGAHLLLRATLQDTTVTPLVQHQRIGHVLSVCDQYDHPFAGLAELIVELSRARLEHDAAYLLTRLSISGNHFRRPLNRMKEEELQDSLVHVEQFANLVSDCMMPKRRKRTSNKTKQSDSDALLSEPLNSESDNSKTAVEVGAIGSFVASRMFAKRERRSSHKKRPKKHKVDVEKLHELCINLQRVWADLAVKAGDKCSLGRLWEWSVANKLDANLRQNRRFRNLFDNSSTKS